MFFIFMVVFSLIASIFLSAAQAGLATQISFVIGTSILTVSSLILIAIKY